MLVPVHHQQSLSIHVIYEGNDNNRVVGAERGGARVAIGPQVEGAEPLHFCAPEAI